MAQIPSPGGVTCTQVGGQNNIYFTINLPDTLVRRMAETSSVGDCPPITVNIQVSPHINLINNQQQQQPVLSGDPSSVQHDGLCDWNVVWSVGLKRKHDVVKDDADVPCKRFRHN